MRKGVDSCFVDYGGSGHVQCGESPSLPRPKPRAGIGQFFEYLGGGDGRGRLGARIRREVLYLYLITGYQLPVTKAKAQCQAIVHTLEAGDLTLLNKNSLLPGGEGVPTDVSGTVINGAHQ